MATSRKKAILRYHTREWVAGYAAPEECAHGESSANRESLELLDLSGKVLAVPLSLVKWLCFVRDFNSGEPANPERLLRKSFSGRPRGEGLWLRLRLQDDDVLEGLAANDRSLLDPAGFLLTPPDTRSNTQRIFVPRTSIVELEIVSVIGAATKQKPPRPELRTEQETLFPPQDLAS